MRTLDPWQRVIWWCFHLLFFVVPLIFTWHNEELFEFNKLLLTYVLTAIIVGAWGARMIFAKKWLIQRTPFDWLIGVWLLSQLVSTVFSINPHISLYGYYTRFHGSLLSSVSYVALFYAFVSNLPRVSIKPLLLTLAASTFLVTLLAIPEHFGHSFSCLIMNSDVRRHAQNHPSLAPVAPDATWFQVLWQDYNTKCWVQDVQSRVFASFGQPNWLAAFIVIVWPVIVWLLHEEPKRRRVFSIICFGGLALSAYATLWFTKSRSGLLGLGVASGMSVLGMLAVVFSQIFPSLATPVTQSKQTQSAYKIAKTRLHEHSESWKRTATLLCLLGLGMMLITVIFRQDAPKTARTSSQAVAMTVNRLDDGGTDSGEIRKIVWRGALKVWQRYPLFGSGLETFAMSYYQDRPAEHNLVSEWDFLFNKAHNEFLNYLATTGIVGFTSYSALVMGFILFFAWQFWQPDQSYSPHTDQNQSRTRSARGLSLAVAAGITALSISNFFGFSTVMVTVLFFLLPASAWVWADYPQWPTRQKTKKTVLESALPARFAAPTARSYQTLSSSQWFGICAIVVFVLLSLSSVARAWLADFAFNRGKQYAAAHYFEAAMTKFAYATQLEPNEPYFYDELANSASTYAAALAQSGLATAAAQTAELAMQAADLNISLNPVHPNGYKTRARVFANLAILQPSLLLEARDALIKAQALAPTDPKVVYQLGIIELSLNMTKQAIPHFEEAVRLKPNYEAARMQLGQQYELASRAAEATAQYQYVLQYIQPSNEIARARVASLAGQQKK